MATIRGSVDAPITTVSGTISVSSKVDTNFAGVAFNAADPVIAENDNWSAVPAEATAATQAARETGAFALATGSKDAALILTPMPGAYTGHVSSADGTSTGTALVEIYELP